MDCPKCERPMFVVKLYIDLDYKCYYWYCQDCHEEHEGERMEK